MTIVRTLLLACLPLVAGAHEGAVPGPPARLYAITVETGMPNLDDNLRHATTHGTACLDPGRLESAFPILADPSLQDCRLALAGRSGATVHYALACMGGHGTEGHADWQFEPDAVRGTLHVKLGGKNMRFYQRITGRPRGACAKE